MNDSPGATQLGLSRIILAFAAIYLIWGSTFLGMRWAVQTLPPFFIMAARYLVAGTVLFALARWRGAPWPKWNEWAAGAVGGMLFFLCSHGAMSWAVQYVPSGVAALLTATVPFWVVLLDWLRPAGKAPTLAMAGGLVIGFGGLAFLIDPRIKGTGHIDPTGAAVLVLAAISWALGSVYTPKLPAPSSKILLASLQMLSGGLFLLIVSAATESTRLHLESVTMRSWLALGYLIAAGSLIGFTSYTWLLSVCTPGLVATYAYVNPLVAVFLGWALAGESVTGREIVAALVILSSVAVIIRGRNQTVAKPAPQAEPALEEA